MTAITAPHPTQGPFTRAWGRVFAAIYEPLMQSAEKGGMADRRRALLAEARGTVVELGAGTGLNLGHYAGDVDLVLTEPDAPMAARLRDRVASAGRAATVVEAPAEAVPVADASTDTVVSTLVLCTVVDVDATLREIRRILKPGGRLLFIEHVAAEPGSRLRRWQDRLHGPWHRFAHGCHTNRATEATLRAGGFEIERIDHGEFEAGALLKPLIWGVARVGAQP